MNSVEELKRIAENKGVIFYGAGDFLKNILSFTELYGISPELIVDNDIKKRGQSYERFIISSSEILQDEKYRGYAILISSKNYADDIETSIKRTYGEKFSVFRFPLEEKKASNYAIEKYLIKPCERMYRELGYLDDHQIDDLVSRISVNRITIPRIPLIITTRCTLRCKECSNLIPLYSQPKDYDANEILMWVEYLLRHVDEIIVLELVGGEPFLHGELNILLKTLINKDSIRKIEITTNGTVLPSKATLDFLKNEKVVVLVSEYPGIVNNQRLINTFKEHDVAYRVMRNMKWISNGNIERRNKSNKSLVRQYEACGPAKYCRTILNGKLFNCSKAASLFELGVNSDIRYISLVNNIESNKMEEQLFDFITRPDYMACDYCDMFSENEKYVHPAEQLNN